MTLKKLLLGCCTLVSAGFLSPIVSACTTEPTIIKHYFISCENVGFVCDKNMIEAGKDLELTLLSSTASTDIASVASVEISGRPLSRDNYTFSIANNTTKSCKIFINKKHINGNIVVALELNPPPPPKTTVDIKIVSKQHLIEFTQKQAVIDGIIDGTFYSTNDQFDFDHIVRITVGNQILRNNEDYYLEGNHLVVLNRYKRLFNTTVEINVEDKLVYRKVEITPNKLVQTSTDRVNVGEDLVVDVSIKEQYANTLKLFSINVEIGRDELDPEKYTVDFDPIDPGLATVTIPAAEITDNVYFLVETDSIVEGEQPVTFYDGITSIVSDKVASSYIGFRDHLEIPDNKKYIDDVQVLCVNQETGKVQELVKGTHYTFDKTDNCLQIFPAAVSGPIGVDLKLKCRPGQYFENDDWENICYYAKGAPERFKETYSNDEDIIGCHKQLNYGGTLYYVRVIGLGQDELAQTSETGEEYATLTLEFEDLIDKSFHPQTQLWMHGSNTVRNYLNGEFANNIPEWLKQNVKTVKKEHATSLYGQDIEEFDEKYFILAADELGGIDGQVSREGRGTYKYYFTSSQTERANRRMKKTLNGSYREYWTCSSSTENNQVWAFIYSNGNGGAGYGGTVSDIGNAHWIAPAFCI